MRRSARLSIALLLAFMAAPSRSDALGPPLMVASGPGTEAVAKRVRAIAGGKRSLRESLALPPPESASPEQVAITERVSSIGLALTRARRAESEASWEACVREAASALGDAVEVLARVDDLGLLRDLHRQLGVCLTLSDSAPSARPHFVAATLLDEVPPKTGQHREEAEAAEAIARAEVLARSHGIVRIDSVPPGADVWIDGRRVPGTTPLEVDVRLGEHFVTMRRFRFEPHTEMSLLQPSGAIRIALDPARRSTLREQLSAFGKEGPHPNPEELSLAEASWARAEQVLFVRARAPQGIDLSVLDAASGALVRSLQVPKPDDDDSLRRGVCSVLGEVCAPESRGIAWYVWPISGIALAGVAISTAFVVNSTRTYRYCFGPCHN